MPRPETMATVEARAALSRSCVGVKVDQCGGGSPEHEPGRGALNKQ